MFEFWETLTLVQKVFYWIAIPSTAVLILQTILTVIGIGNGGSDHVELSLGDEPQDVPDFHDLQFDDAQSADDVNDSVEPGGFRLITIKGIVAFFAVFGWTGIVVLAKGWSILWTTVIAFQAGLLALTGVAAILYAFSRIQSDGTLQLEHAIGQTATVYIPVSRKPGGKVQIFLQEQLRELPAITYMASVLPTGSMVTITDVEQDTTLVVIPNDQKALSEQNSLSNK